MDFCRFESSLVYIVSSRTAVARERETLPKTTTKMVSLAPTAEGILSPGLGSKTQQDHLSISD